jgi:hypothetical protein
MFELKLDFSAFERKAIEMGQALDQVPYALSVALNTAAENTRNLLIQDTWPKHVHQRNSGFMRYALRREFATKNNLRTVIFDKTGKDYVKRLDTGGTKVARGANLAIPTSNVRVGSHGVVQSQRPRNLTNTFVADLHGRGPAVWKFGKRIKVGKKKKTRSLKLMYVLKPSVQIGALVPFTDDFLMSMMNETRTSFPSAMARAMKSRRV